MIIKNNILIITSLSQAGKGIDAIREHLHKNYKNFNVVVITEAQYGKATAATIRGRTHERMVQSVPTFYRKYKSAKLAITLKTPNIDKKKYVAKKLRGSTRKIYNAIIRFTPEAIVVTTPQLIHEVVFAKKRTRYKYPVIGLCQDFTFDKAFFNPAADGYIVENNEMKNQLTAMGYSSNRIYVLGLPIEEKLPDVDSLIKKKERLGINLNPTVYLSGGEIGSKELMPVYELLLDQGDIINIVADCGRNDGLYAAMLREAEKRNAENVNIYMDGNEEVADILPATDCLVTIYDSELIYRAFLLGIPVIAYAPDNTLERADMKYLKDKGLIYYAEDYNHVIIGVYDIIQNNLGKKLSEAASVRTRANSLDDICACLTSLGLPK